MFCLGAEITVAVCVFTEQQMGHSSMIIFLQGGGGLLLAEVEIILCGLEAKIITPSSLAKFIMLQKSTKNIWLGLFKTKKKVLIFVRQRGIFQTHHSNSLKFLFYCFFLKNHLYCSMLPLFPF